MKVLSVEQIRRAEKSAVLSGLFSYADLMKNAGKSAFEEIVGRYDVVGKRFLILVGSGNNGGDGLVIADMLRNSGAFVELYLPFGLPKTDTARIFVKSVSNIPVCDRITKSYDFYVDALFGIGLNRPLSPESENLINFVNTLGGVKISVDIPSGIIADGGRTQAVFNADLTVTFIGYKLSQLLPETSDFCGEIVLKDLNTDVKNDYSYLTIDPPKPRKFVKNSHKGTFGTVLTVCGSYGMCGAAVLSAKAAAVSGAGIVKSVVCDKNYSAFTQSVPEAVTIPVETSADGAPIIYEKTALSALSGVAALLIGCGLGKTDAAKNAVKKFLKVTDVPTVIDADGINMLADNIDILRGIRVPYILTPHPGEAARLFNTTVSDIEAHRVQYAKKFACRYNCVMVLKGANTVVAAPDGEVYFNVTGNPGMAKGGSGDVLSGIIAALLANGYDTLQAALTAVYVHGAAGDRAAGKYTTRTMLPGDILEELKFISF